MHRAFVNAACALLYLSGGTHLAYWLNRHRQVIITYHNVLPDRMLDDGLHSWEAHAESVFAKQLAIILRRLPVTTELGRPGTCLITFDDGYRNNACVAGPYLAQAGAHAYFFVPLETAQRGEPNWVDKFRLWLGAAPSGTYRIAGREIAIGDTASRHRAAGQLWQVIEADYAARHVVLADMSCAAPFDSLPIDPELRALRYEGMSRLELERLAEAGHKIGCHSRAHDILSRLSTSEIEADFAACAGSRATLYNTDIYAYPFGGASHLDERAISACRSAGFSAALLYIRSLAGTAFKSGPFAIPRQTLPNTGNGFVIEAKLSGIDDLVRRVAGFARYRKRKHLARVGPPPQPEPAS